MSAGRPAETRRTTRFQVRTTPARKIQWETLARAASRRAKIAVPLSTWAEQMIAAAVAAGLEPDAEED